MSPRGPASAPKRRAARGEGADARQIPKMLIRRIFGRSLHKAASPRDPRRKTSRTVSTKGRSWGRRQVSGGGFSGASFLARPSDSPRQRRPCPKGEGGGAGQGPPTTEMRKARRLHLPFSLTWAHAGSVETSICAAPDPKRRDGQRLAGRFPRVPSPWILLFRRRIPLPHTPHPENSPPDPDSTHIASAKCLSLLGNPVPKGIKGD